MSRVQWHPLFAKMLRPIVEGHYEVRTNLPVGDVPRSADIVLLRRTSNRPAPFRTLLHHLTNWNILEFKGRSVTPRLRDLDLLVELGLGVDRRLNEELVRQRQRPVEAAEVSFWYIANHLGRRFMHEAREVLGGVEEVSPGVWRSHLLRRSLFLVDGRTVPVDRETVPIHLVGEESPEIDRALAAVIVEEPGFWERYGPLLNVLHPSVWREATRMARSRGKGPVFNLRPLIEEVGLDQVVAQIEFDQLAKEIDLRKLVETIGPKRFRKEVGTRWLLSDMSEKERQELLRELTK
jgi:hypothetical protein